MSRFDDELRRATAPLAQEPLPDGVLDEALDAPPARTYGARVGAVLAATVLIVVAVALTVRREAPGVEPVPLISAIPSVSAEARGTPSPSPSAVPAAAPTPDAPATPHSSRTPGPTPGEPVVVVSAEEDAIRLALDLDRSEVAHGDRVWATLTVQNVGTDSVWWAYPGYCPFPHVVARSALLAAIPYGRGDWSGAAAEFKDFMYLDPVDYAGFAPEERIDREGPFGCVTTYFTDEIPAGGNFVYRAGWDVFGSHGMPAPPGEYSVSATLRYINRGPDPDPPNPQLAVTVEAPLRVTGPQVDYLAPGEAVDRALEDPEFSAQLMDLHDRWIWGYVSFDEGTWRVWVDVHSPQGSLVATVDPVTGAVTSVDLGPRRDPPGG